jgi:hypothetical protein
VGANGREVEAQGRGRHVRKRAQTGW